MTKVRIRNFQSIGDINLEIDGFTVVVGKSDIGKSAVIRAIDAALSNQSGDAFIKHGQTCTTVNINYQSTEIEWKKGDTSSYKINGESFTKLNRAIPKPLMDAGFSKVEIGDQKINPLVASQFEPIFLLDKPGSVVTEVLSKLYKLNVLSSADDKCQKELKSNKSLLKTRELDITGLKEKLKSYDGFDSIKEAIKVLANMEKESITINKIISEIASYEKTLNETLERYKKLSGISTVKVPNIKVISDSIETVTWVSEKSDTLQELVKSVKSLKNSSTIDIPTYDTVNTLIEELNKLTLWDNSIINSNSTMKKMENIPSFDSFLNSSEEIGKISELVSSIAEMEKELTSVATSAKSARDELRKIETELISATEEEKKEKELLGGLCPVCGKSL